MGDGQQKSTDITGVPQAWYQQRCSPAWLSVSGTPKRKDAMSCFPSLLVTNGLKPAEQRGRKRDRQMMRVHGRVLKKTKPKQTEQPQLRPVHLEAQTSRTPSSRTWSCPTQVCVSRILLFIIVLGLGEPAGTCKLCSSVKTFIQIARGPLNEQHSSCPGHL